ncbi:MAG: hypothetical protein Q8L55_11655 [Phycisphaerales bacterium]|nr:hypothetical protein [Phycisphaerales bacterium]
MARPRKKQSVDTKTAVIGGIAALIIASSILWMVFINTEPAGEPRPPETDVTRAVSAAWPSIEPMTRDLLNAQIMPSDDGKAVVLKGRVRSQAVIDRVKAIFDAYQPPVEFRSEATIGN